MLTTHQAGSPTTPRRRGRRAWEEVAGELVVDGVRRTWTGVVPHRLAADPALLVVLHGSHQGARRVRRATGYGFDLLAAEHGFVVAYPNAHRGLWTDARLASPVPARADGVEDATFLLALVGALSASHGTDPSRAFAVGFSNGGQMAFRLAGAAPGAFAGLAAIGATWPAPENLRGPAPTAPVPLLLINGTADPIVPFEGGVISLFGFAPRGRALSSAETTAVFTALNGLTAPPRVVELPHWRGSRGTSVTLRTFAEEGRAPVAEYTVHGGGHVVPTPGLRAPRILGRTTRDVDAPVAVWDFFRGLAHAPAGAAWPPADDGVLRATADAPGGPEVLVLRPGAHRAPGDGEVVIAVEAAGVASGDVQARQGTLPARFPYTPGYDAVGRVVAVGSGVHDLALGQRVAAYVGTGGCATEVVARAELSVPVPDDLPAEALSALVLNYTTAQQLLHRAVDVPAGGSVLVLGAAGGVGSALVDLALLDGLTVYGSASPGRRDALAARGVRVLARGEAPPDRVDATFDGVGGSSLARSRRATEPSGTVVSFGVSGAAGASASVVRALAGWGMSLARARATAGAAVRPYAISTATKRDPAAFRADLGHVVELLRAERISPRVTTLPLSDVVDAHRLLQEGSVAGKLVLLP